MIGFRDVPVADATTRSCDQGCQHVDRLPLPPLSKLDTLANGRQWFDAPLGQPLKSAPGKSCGWWLTGEHPLVGEVPIGRLLCWQSGSTWYSLCATFVPVNVCNCSLQGRSSIGLYELDPTMVATNRNLSLAAGLGTGDCSGDISASYPVHPHSRQLVRRLQGFNAPPSPPPPPPPSPFLPPLPPPTLPQPPSPPPPSYPPPFPPRSPDHWHTFETCTIEMCAMTRSTRY